MKQLILWHGWGMHPSAWDRLAAQLASAHGVTPRAQAVPGYAAVAAPETYTPDVLVDAMLAGVSTPVVLCGWSLGAMLGMHAAQRHPDKVARLILIGATPSFVQRVDWPHGMTPQALTEFSNTVAGDAKAGLKRFIALFNQNDVHARSIGRDLARALATDALPSDAVLAAGLALLRDIDLRAQVPKIVQPTLLLHGAHDALMPLAAATWLATALPHARLEILPDAAHAPFLSDVERCASLITDFMHA